MNQVRLPTSVVLSMGFHGGLLLMFAMLMREGPKKAIQVVGDVQLMVQQKQALPRPAQQVIKPPKLSTMDFLKLAIPTQHHAGPATIDIKIPQHKTELAMPKLEEAKLHNRGPKLDPLEMNRERSASTAMDVKVRDTHRAAADLAALPRLEDVGRHQVRDLPTAEKLEDRRREAVAMGVAPSAETPTRRRALEAMSTPLEDAGSPPPSGGRSSRSSFLPDGPALEERHHGSAPAMAIAPEPPKVERRVAAPVAEGPRKAVQIEGKVKNRRVLARKVPAFPKSLANRGVLEADVAIEFTVDEDGTVRSGSRVVAPSGYSEVDDLAMDALNQWRFAAKPGAGIESGVITFRFILE